LIRARLKPFFTSKHVLAILSEATTGTAPRPR
jgi:hypothetical protein